MACEVSCSCFAALKFEFGFLICRSFASTAPAFCKTFVRSCPDSAINKHCYVKILLTVNRNTTLCYQGHKGGNKPRSETRPAAAALRQKMGWSANCPCPCSAWPALALQAWTPPSQAMWQFPGSQFTTAPSSEPQPRHKVPWCVCFDVSAGRQRGGAVTAAQPAGAGNTFCSYPPRKR